MLICADCGTPYEDPAPWRCSCGGPLDFAETPLPDGPPPALGDLDVRRGLWAFSDFLPVEPRVTLGEGTTPLVDAPGWGASFTLEYVSPSGSFKDRGATTALSRAIEVGAERVVDDSSGNAGAAIALYAARAGIDAEIYVPADAKESKRRAIERVGAEVVEIEGSRADVTAACVERAEAGDAWYASHAWDPAFFAGTTTFALELCAQRDWTVPDAVVLPAGHGTLLLGAYRGFEALRGAGWIDRLPRLLAVQAAGTAPLVAARGGDAAGDNDIADGIRIAEPARRDQLLDAIDATGGEAIAVDADETRDALDRLRRSGFDVEPTSAAAPAALERYRERGAIDPDADVVVPLTGSGLKE